MSKVKFYKNPNRGSETVKPYTPEYQLRGIEPEPFLPSMPRVQVIPPIKEPAQKAAFNAIASIPTPYASDWAALDGELVDDIGDPPPTIPNHLVENDPDHSVDLDHGLYQSLSELQEEEFLLLIKEVPICSGTLSDVQEIAKSLIFGEHEICDGNTVPLEDLLILKRIKIKVGVFLEA